MAGKFDNTLPDQDYDKYETWSEYYNDMQKEGLSDDQIASRIRGSKWANPESNAGKWLSEKENAVPSPVTEGLGQTSGYNGDNPEEERKAYRKLYADDNKGYREKMASEGLTPEVDPEQKYKMKTIQQAYYDGDIDKDTRDYLLIDTFSKFARNMGKDIGNIAAAYSGGTVNNDRETSQWDARNAAMAQSGINAEQNQLKGTSTEQQYRGNEASITGKELDNRVKVLQKTPAENFAKEAQSLYAKANDPKLSAEERKQYKMQARLLDLVGAASTQNIGAEEYIATLATDPEVQKLLGEVLKGVSKGAMFGSDLVNTTVGTLEAGLNTFKGADKAVNESKALTAEEKNTYNTTKDKKKKQEMKDKALGTVGGMYLMQ
jgi:hypothetical protein